MRLLSQVDEQWLDTVLTTLTFDSEKDSQAKDGVHIIAECLAGLDWTLKDFYSQRDAARNPELAENLSVVLGKRDVIRAFAPSAAAMSAVVINKSRLKTLIVLRNGIEIWRNPELPADCIADLAPREAVMFSIGGCPIATATGNGRCMVAHIGRDSAIDRNYVLASGKPREHFSIVDTMADRLLDEGILPSSMTFRCFFPIPGGCFSHPQHDNEHEVYNRSMELELRNRYGPEVVPVKDDVAYLDMRLLALAQAEQHGFVIDTSANHELEEEGDHGHTRHPTRKFQRNLGIVRRVS